MEGGTTQKPANRTDGVAVPLRVLYFACLSQHTWALIEIEKVRPTIFNRINNE